MKTFQERFRTGATNKGVTPDVVEQIWEQVVAFANYGFPESHSVSFAHLAYASCWIKHHYPAAFCAALINSQPMGFYSPHTLVQDARRHGVEVRTPDVQRSMDLATLEPDGSAGLAIRLGLRSVRGIGEEIALAIAAGRPWRSIEDLQHRLNLGRTTLETLATAGAFGCFDLDRRSALWSAGAIADSRSDQLVGMVTGLEAPPLPAMSAFEIAQADLLTTGLSPDGHPTRFLRRRLAAAGVSSIAELCSVTDGHRVKVAGVVTHLQRPSTAKGTLFISLEDETGLVNVVISKGCWTRFKKVAIGTSSLVIGGRLERATDSEKVFNVIAERIQSLDEGVSLNPRNFC